MKCTYFEKHKATKPLQKRSRPSPANLYIPTKKEEAAVSERAFYLWFCLIADE